MKSCTGLVLQRGGTFRLCGEPAVAVYSFGCVHEHIRPDMPICVRHENQARDVGCVECLTADGHNCPMVMRLVGRLDGADAPG